MGAKTFVVWAASCDIAMQMELIWRFKNKWNSAELIKLCIFFVLANLSATLLFLFVFGIGSII